MLSRLRSPWTVTMIGAVLEDGYDPVLVMEYMDLGSLHSLLHNTTIDVDPESMRMMVRRWSHGATIQLELDAQPRSSTLCRAVASSTLPARPSSTAT